MAPMVLVDEEVVEVEVKQVLVEAHNLVTERAVEDGVLE